jgi:hypothetical protein
VEKCEKLWRPDRDAMHRNALQGEVYGVSAARKMRACSACAGDYEDPDRTTWVTDGEEEDEPGSAPRETTIEFPDEDR